MTKLSNVVLGSALALALAACGSGGNGSGTTKPATAAPETTTKPTPEPTTPAKPAPTTSSTPPTSSSNASYNSGVYTFTTPDGKKYDVTAAPFKAGSFANLTDSRGTLALGGTTYTYTRFGAFQANDGKKDVFYTGSATPSSAVPTTGTAVYTGHAARAGAGSSTMTYNVDFGAKSINGSGTSGNGFGDALSLQGTLAGSGFSGKATSGSAEGTFSGGFYGPAAQELSGNARFSNNNLDAAFGGRK